MAACTSVGSRRCSPSPSTGSLYGSMALVAMLPSAPLAMRSSARIAWIVVAPSGAPGSLAVSEGDFGGQGGVLSHVGGEHFDDLRVIVL